MTWQLHPPGTRGRRYWYVRGRVDGVRFEVSTKTTDRAAAEEFASRFVADFTAGIEHDPFEPDRAIPKPVRLGPFEQFLRRTFRVVGGRVVTVDGRKPVRGVNRHRGNYVQISVSFNGGRRQFYEHRLVFLLTHGWLPEVVDHIDGDATNNRIENLRASTPLLNARHRPKNRGIPPLQDRQEPTSD